MFIIMKLWSWNNLKKLKKKKSAIPLSNKKYEEDSR